MIQRRLGEPNYFYYERNPEFFITAWAQNNGGFGEIDPRHLYLPDKNMKGFELQI